MPAKGYAQDLRERVAAMVEATSRREAAHILNLAPSTAVRCLDLRHETGVVANRPAPRGSSHA
jgi:transposase